MTDQNEEYTQDTSQEQNDAGGPEIPKFGERVRNFFGGNKRGKNPKQEAPRQENPQPQEEPKQEQPKPRKYKDIWSKYEEDAYDESIPWQKEVKEKMKADPTFKRRWGRYNGFESSGLKNSPSSTKISSFDEGRDEEEKNWRRYKMAYGLSQDDDIDYGTNVYLKPNKSWDEFKQEFEEERDPTLVGRNHNRDLFNNFWDSHGRVSPYSRARYGDDPSYIDWNWMRHSPFRRFDYKSPNRVDATDDDKRMADVANFMENAKLRWGGGSYRSRRLDVEGYPDLSASNYQNKRIKDIFGEDTDDPDFFKFIDTIRESDDPRDQALFNEYLKSSGYKEEDLDRLREDYYHYREQQHGVGRDGKPINPQQEQPQPGPTQEQSQTTEAGGSVEDVSATVDGKPANAEIVTENNRLPATGREGVQETSQDVTQYKEPRETYIEPDDHPGPYTGAPKELGSGPTQDNGGTNATALAPSTKPPSGGATPSGGNNPSQTPSGAAPYDLKAERNALAKQHAAKFLNAFAQTAAEIGGQMASKGWDLAGNIVKMTFTQPHAMSSSSRLIGTAMSALQTAGDFADRSMEKYKIDANADPNLMKNTIRYKLYKREAQMGKNTVGNTFRAISESLGNMGLQDASQMTPDQLEQHVADMQAEADRLIQASKDPKLSAMDRSLIKAQADHLQGYMTGLGKQGATMAQNQRMAARRQKRQDLATRRQNYQTLADGSPNPYKEALEWADPKYGIEVDPQTGRPTNPSAYNRMLNAVITQHQNEVAAAGGKLDPAREKWFNDLQNKIHNDIQAMKQDKAENPLRGRAEIYARIGRVAPGFEKYIDNIEKTGTFPSNSTQSTRAIRKVLADYLFELENEDKQGTPEYNHARALLTAMDKYNNMKKLMSRIAGLMPNGAERAQRIHQEAEDPYAGLDYSDNGKINDYTALVQLYANLMKVLPRDPKGGAAFNPDDPAYKAAESRFNDNLTYYINKWFPGAGWSVDNNYDEEEEDDDDDADDKPGDSGDGSDENYSDVDRFVSEAFQYLFGGDTDGPKPSVPKPPRPPRTASRTPQTPQTPKTSKGPKIEYSYAPPITEKDRQFQSMFHNWKVAKEYLKRLGHITDSNPIMTPEVYTKFRENYIKAGGSPETFDSSPFTRHMPFELRSPVEQVIFDLDGSLRPAKQRRNPRVTVKGWKERMRNALSMDENKEILDLMVKNAQGVDLTDEEKSKVMQFMIQNKFRKSSKLTPPGKTETQEVPVEEEGAEQPQLPAVTENDFIKPEVASQFKDSQSIESINNGLAEIANAASNAGAARAYDDVLWGLANELGDDALLSDEYKGLMDNALSEGSDRAFQLKANAAQDPDEKLMYLMARASLAQDLSSSQQSNNALDAFLKSNAAKYDYDAVKKIVKNNEDTFLKVKSREDGTAFINKMLSAGLDPSVKLNKEDETPVDEEEEEGGEETPVSPDSTEQFEFGVPPEQDKGFGKDLTFPEGGQYKDFKSMAEAMGADFKAKDAWIAKSSKSPNRIKKVIGGWLSEKGINVRKGAEDSAILEIFKYLSKNNLINDVLPKKKSKDKDLKVDENLENMKDILAAGPAADANSIKKDKNAVSSFNRLLRNALKNGNLSEEEKSSIEQRFNDFINTRESDLKKQYSNFRDMAWRKQAVEDFKKTLSEIELAKITPGKAENVDLHNEDAPKEPVPKFDKSGDPHKFGESMRAFRKNGWSDKVHAYLGPMEDHDTAIKELDLQLRDIEDNIDKLSKKKGYNEDDEKVMNDLIGAKREIVDEMNKWKGSKDVLEGQQRAAEYGEVFKRVWEAARNYDEVDQKDLDYLNDNLKNLPEKAKRDYNLILSSLDEKVHAARNVRRTLDATEGLEELERLKSEASQEESFDMETQVNAANQKKIDKIAEEASLGFISRKDLDDIEADMLGRIGRMSKEDAEEYLDKWEEAKHAASVIEIWNENFESEDPSKWLKEISSEKDLDKLEKKKKGYEKYIKLFDKKSQAAMEKELDKAYKKAANRPKLSDVASNLVQSIYDRGARSFNINGDDERTWKKAMSDASDAEKAQYEKFWEEKVKPAIAIAKILEDNFHTTYSEVTRNNNDIWRTLSGKVGEAYGQSEEAGNSAESGYLELMRKLRLSGNDKMIAENLLKNAKPKEQTTKSLSVRDLFRARNPDWE